MIKWVAVAITISLSGSLQGGDGPPVWVKQLERFDIPFHIDWDVEIHHRPNPKLAEILRSGKHTWSIDYLKQVQSGQIIKKKFSMIALNCRNFRASVLNINLYAENCTTEYSSKGSEGSKVKIVGGGLPKYYPEPMRYFGSLSTGILQTQILDFLPSANDARIVREDQWPRIYELISDGPP